MHRSRRSPLAPSTTTIKPSETDHTYSKVLCTPDTYSQSREPSLSSCSSHRAEKKKQPNFAFRKHKRRLSCRTCAACLREDCGKCVSCLDMKKFGGPNIKKQRCQFRMCLVVEMRRKRSKSRPRPGATATKPQCSQRGRQTHEKTKELSHHKEEAEEQKEFDKYRRLGEVEEWSEGVMKRGTYYEIEVELPASDSEEDTLSSHRPNVTHDNVSTDLTSEVTEPDVINEPQDGIPLSLGVISLFSDDDMGRWVLLQLFNALRRMPLPPHWVCVLADGPVLQLLQCSWLSSVADTIVHIQPDRCFYVTVQGRPLPDTHTLYCTHTRRIVHLSQVVSLLLELELLNVCRGWRVRSSTCQPERRSPACHQLVALPFLSCLPCVLEEQGRN